MARAGDQVMWRYLDNGAHYLSISECSLHFGLGHAERVDELLIRWADGTETVLTDVRADQTLTITSP